MGKKLTKKEREKQLEDIKKKYQMDDKYIYVCNDSKRIIISKNNLIFEREIKSPATLTKYIKLLKAGNYRIYNYEEQKLLSFDEYREHKMILRLAGVE